MPFVVAEPCVKCKYTDCVTVCPVDCFHEGEDMLVIHPDECIDCGACVPECPVEAIFLEEDLPGKWANFAGLNARYADQWPVLTQQRDPMPSAEAMKNETGKVPSPNAGAGD